MAGSLSIEPTSRKILKQSKGYFGARGKLYRVAREQVMKSGQYAYIGRKQFNDFRVIQKKQRTCSFLLF